jgi:hypothetical protein
MDILKQASISTDAWKAKKSIERIKKIYPQVREKLKKSQEKYKGRHD